MRRTVVMFVQRACADRNDAVTCRGYSLTSRRWTIKNSVRFGGFTHINP